MLYRLQSLPPVVMIRATPLNRTQWSHLEKLLPHHLDKMTLSPRLRGERLCAQYLLFIKSIEYSK